MVCFTSTETRVGEGLGEACCAELKHEKKNGADPIANTKTTGLDLVGLLGNNHLTNRRTTSRGRDTDKSCFMRSREGVNLMVRSCS
jgi:hypothetical protein